LNQVVEGLPLLLELADQAGKAQTCSTISKVLGPLFAGEQLASVRDELVTGLRGLQPYETEDAFAMVCALDDANLSYEEIPKLAQLLATLESNKFRGIVEKAMGSQPLAPNPHLVIVAVPPGGYWLPQVVAGSRANSNAIHFTLFLTEEWWSEADGGIIEVFGQQDATPYATVLPSFNTLLVHPSNLCTAAVKIVTDRAPLLAIHGVFNPLEIERPHAVSNAPTSEL